MAITVTIGGVNRSNAVLITSLTISMAWRSTWTATFTTKDRRSTSSAYRPALDDVVIIADGATELFRGWIFGITDAPIAAPHIGTRVTVQCRSVLALLDSTTVDKVYGTDPLGIANSSIANPTSITTVQPHGYVTGNRVVIEGHVGSTAGVNGTHVVTVTSHSTFTVPINNTTSGGGGTARQVTPANLIVSDLGTTYLVPKGVTLDTFSTAADISKCVWKGVTLRQVFDDLMLATGWIVRIVPPTELQFFAAGVKTTSYSLTAANHLNVGPVEWTQQRQRFVDKVRLNFGSDAVIPKTDTITGDGATNVWALQYHPAVDANGVIVSSGYVADTGTYSPLGLLSDIVSSSVANPTVITTAQPHGFQAGASVSVVIQSHAGSTPAISGTYTATITGLRTFTIPVNVTVAGTGGSVYQGDLVWLYYPTTNSLFRVGALTSEHLAEFTYSAQFPDYVIAGSGLWEGVYDAPEIYDVKLATQLAAGILRRETAKPKMVTTATRQGFTMPGDTIVLTYTDRTISGSHLIQTVEASVDADQHVRYAITAVTGTEFRDTALDIQRDTLLGGGGNASGTTISGSVVGGGPSGVISGRIQGERVVIEKRGTVHLELHPLEVPDPDATERRYIDIEGNPSWFAITQRTQHTVDAFTDIGMAYIDLTGGTNSHWAGNGLWTSVAFNAANFSGTGGMTVTVASGDVLKNRYTLSGKTLYWQIDLATFTCAAAAGLVGLTLPGGFVAAVNGVNVGTAYISDAGSAFAHAVVQSSAASSLLTIVPIPGFTWSGTGTNTNHAYADIRVEIE